MTKKRALQILIENTAANIAGSGTGIRSVPADDAKQDARQAIVTLFKDAHGRHLDNNDAYNLRLPW